MTADPVTSSTAAGVATIRLSRPEKRNALTAAMVVDLLGRVESAIDDAAIGAILLAGDGRAFCSGQDLAERYRKPGDRPPDLGASLDGRYNPLIRRLVGSPKPVIAAVNGVAAGAGANLALSAHVVIAATDARFVEAFAGVGLIPDCGGTWTLPRLVGSARAGVLSMLARPIDGTTAAAWGLIWRVVPAHRLDGEADRLARTLASSYLAKEGR